MRRTRVLAPLFAVLIILAVVGGSAYVGGPADPVGEAEAIVCGGACMIGIGLIGIGVGATAIAAYDKYMTGEDVTAKDLKSADANETKLNIYKTMATQKQETENYLTLMNNYLEDTRTIARLEGKMRTSERSIMDHPRL